MNTEKKNNYLNYSKCIIYLTQCWCGIGLGYCRHSLVSILPWFSRASSLWSQECLISINILKWTTRTQFILFLWVSGGAWFTCCSVEYIFPEGHGCGCQSECVQWWWSTIMKPACMVSSHSCELCNGVINTQSTSTPVVEQEIGLTLIRLKSNSCFPPSSLHSPWLRPVI